MCQVFRLHLQQQRYSSPFDRQFLVFYMVMTLQYHLHVLFLCQFLIGRKVLHSIVVDSFNVYNFSSKPHLVFLHKTISTECRKSHLPFVYKAMPIKCWEQGVTFTTCLKNNVDKILGVTLTSMWTKQWKQNAESHIHHLCAKQSQQKKGEPLSPLAYKAMSKKWEELHSPFVHQPMSTQCTEPCSTAVCKAMS